MGSSTAPGTMTGDEIVELTKRHTIFEWSAQAKVDPLPVVRAKGVYFWTSDGKRVLDFNSQLMCVNIGHSHPRVIKAIQEQAATLAYANPFMATEPRELRGDRLQRPAALLEQPYGFGLELGGEPASRPGHPSPPGWNRSTLATRPRRRGRLTATTFMGVLGLAATCDWLER